MSTWKLSQLVPTKVGSEPSLPAAAEEVRCHVAQVRGRPELDSEKSLRKP